MSLSMISKRYSTLPCKRTSPVFSIVIALLESRYPPGPIVRGLHALRLFPPPTKNRRSKGKNAVFP